jgi:hypothetical protein
MSRLTETEYFIHHEQLHRMWHRGPGYFGFLTIKQQRDFHAHYQTTSEDTWRTPPSRAIHRATTCRAI